MVEDAVLCSVCGEYDYDCTCGGEDWKARALAAEAKVEIVMEWCENEQRRIQSVNPKRSGLLVLHDILAILDTEEP